MPFGPKNNVIEALNLVLEKYSAEIQLPGNITQLLSMPQSSTQSSCMADTTLARQKI
jgi:hypothetical protein